MRVSISESISFPTFGMKDLLMIRNLEAVLHGRKLVLSSGENKHDLWERACDGKKNAAMQALKEP